MYTGKSDRHKKEHTVMKSFKLFVGIVLILAFVAAMIFTVESIRHGLPAEGAMKGNIRA